MVDSIGSRLLTAGQGVTKIAPATPVAAPEGPVRSPADAAPKAAPDATQLSGTAQTLASSAPVDLERVARIKRAIADGNFPILPSTIADQMIALKMDWVSREKA